MKFMRGEAAVVLLLCWGSIISQGAYATKVQTPANVQVVSVLTDETKWGGCFARLNINQSALGLNCTLTSVTFDCLNSLGTTSKSSAERNFNQAQLAFVTGKNTQFIIDDSRKVNNMCFAERIDVLN